MGRVPICWVPRRGALTLCLALLAAAQLGDDPDFDTFVSSTGKVYSSPEESTFRRLVFDANKARIEAHNSQNLPFTLGVTPYADLTTAEFDAQRGIRGLLLDDEPMVGTAPGDLLGYWGAGWEASPGAAWPGFVPGPPPRPPLPVVEPSRPPPAPPPPQPSSAGVSPAPSEEAPSPSGAASSAPSRSPSRTPSRAPASTPTPTRAPSSTRTPTPTRPPSPPPAPGGGGVDWVGAGKVTSVVNQGSCGSCYSFAVADSVSSLASIRSGSLPVLLSFQQIVDCSANSGCNGGALSTTFNYVRTAGGLCLSTAYPYTASQGTCRAASCPKPVTITGYTNVAQNNDAAMAAALQSQPVVVAVQASGSAWQLYKSGVMTTACGTALDHAVLATGYGVDPATGIGFWRIKNSWGQAWGEAGYLRLARGPAYNGQAGQCGILMTPAFPRM